MEIDFKSAKITVDIEVSKPGTGTDLNSTSLHLSRNADPMFAGETASDVDLSAINIHATVQFLDDLSQGDNISNLKFRFLQLALHLQGFAKWAGYT